MFIKEGAIIPKQDVQDFVGQETVDHVTVDIFPSGRETSFRYYDDDGETYDYEDGQVIVVQSGVVASIDCTDLHFGISGTLRGDFQIGRAHV